MDYFEIAKLLEETMDEVLEPVDESNALVGWSNKMFNLGVKQMFHRTLLNIANREQEVRSNV